MKTIFFIISIAIICTSCSSGNLEILLKTMEEETIESAIDFVSQNCEETMAMLDMKYIEYPLEHKDSWEKAHLASTIVQEFELTVLDIRSENSKKSMPLEKLIDQYKATLDALEAIIPEGWEDQYSETSRDYYLKSYSKLQLSRIALLMRNDIVLNEAFVLKVLFNYSDRSE